ncbi:MAG: hypothetical protein MJA27_29175, partial [Pseudanabaenales cyanobacterium]|nr:hypothetical protein [Pseudanabaenales cyanobacterium]
MGKRGERGKMGKRGERGRMGKMGRRGEMRYVGFVAVYTQVVCHVLKGLTALILNASPWGRRTLSLTPYYPSGRMLLANLTFGNIGNFGRLLRPPSPQLWGSMNSKSPRIDAAGELFRNISA